MKTTQAAHAIREIVIRLVSVDSLGKIGAPKAENALEAVILQDEFAPIHETARNALERIKKGA